MANIILDPAGAGKINGKVGIAGKVIAYENNGNVVIATLHGVNIASGSYQDYKTAENATFANNQEVLDYVQENFSDASGDGGVTMEEVTAITDKKADLDINNKVPLSQINDALIGNVHFKGLYDGATITTSPDSSLVGQPLPAASSGNTGWYFISTTSYTNNSISYQTGDWIISIGTEWSKVDNTDAVSSVNTKVGPVVIGPADLAVAQNNFIVGDGTNKGSVRTILPSDFAISASNRIPVSTSASAWTNMSVQSTATASTIAYRTATGQVKVVDAVNTDEAVTLSQLSNPNNINATLDNFLVGNASGKAAARKILPSDLNITTDSYTMYKNGTSFNQIQISPNISASVLVQRTAAGLIKSGNPTATDEVVTLGYLQTSGATQMNVTSGSFIVGDTNNKGSVRTIKPSDVGISAAQTGTRVPTKTSGSDDWSSGGYILSTASSGNTIPVRTGTGQIKAAAASATDEAVILSQFSPTLNNALTTSETSTSLNTTYPSAVIGQVVLSITNSVKYIKLTSTQWEKVTITIV